MNLTVLYALLAYAGVKQKCNGNQQVSDTSVIALDKVRESLHFCQGDHNSERVCRTILSYLVAWWVASGFISHLTNEASLPPMHSPARLLPMVLVMLLFAAVVANTHLLQDVNDCSCWCRPSLGNIIPSAKGRDPVSFREFTFSHMFNDCVCIAGDN